mmetsp:Transcript_6082/g.9326  ORF Transcript_6082/g.9326 Transcript_6082/m.9326 type:complete len:168 (+) Transcript_6082:112-615(+)
MNFNNNDSQKEEFNQSDDNDNNHNDSQIEEFNQKSDDELYARRLQEEEEKNCYVSKDDEEYAKRLALELREERFAETMQALEEAQFQMQAEQIHYVKGETTTGVEQPASNSRKKWFSCCSLRSNEGESFWNVVLITMISTFLVVLFLIFFSPIGRMVGFQSANCSNP